MHGRRLPRAYRDEVARTMAVRRQGSAVVVRDRHIVGVFTTTDALRVLADSLEGKTPRARSAEVEAAKLH